MIPLAPGAEPPLPLPIWPLRRDLEDRRRDLRGLLGAMHAYLWAALGGRSAECPRDLDLRKSRRCTATAPGFGTLCYAGWGPRSTGELQTAMPSSKPSSYCPGRECMGGICGDLGLHQGCSCQPGARQS